MKIDLMAMQFEPPDTSCPKEVQNYFISIEELIKRNTRIQIRRLVSIQTEAKFNWVYNMIRTCEKCSQFSVRYVNVDILYDDVPEEESEALPYPANIQIIDREHVFFINPKMGYFMPTDVEDSYNIYINSKEIGELYSSYYDRFFKASKPILQQQKIIQETMIKIRGKILQRQSGTD
jgi:hypothetical protein